MLLVVALLFIGYLLRSQWAELSAQPWRLHSGWLMLSVLFLLASWVTEVAIWQGLLRHVGGRLPFWPAVRIWFLSAITRYVPGNIWQPLSMTMRCQTMGVRAESTIASVLLFQVVILMAAGPIAALYFGWSGNYGLVSGELARWGNWLLALILLPVLIFLYRPDWLFALANWGLQKLGRPPLDVTLSSLQLFGFLGTAIIHWFFWGCSFAALTFAINAEAAAQIGVLSPHLVASFAIAYSIGFVSFITPSGFGVREGVFVILLAPLLGGGPTTLAALAMRVLAIICEVIMAVVCFFFEGRAVASQSSDND